MKILLLGFFLVSSVMADVHPDFLSLGDICPDMKIQASYSTEHNFTGSVVNGYKAKKAFMAKAPAKALCEVQKAAMKKGYTLKIFDSYRPVKAVQFFINWAQKVILLLKSFIIPNLPVRNYSKTAISRNSLLIHGEVPLI
jgi:D-alanyl-D-alanine dipeptidase